MLRIGNEITLDDHHHHQNGKLQVARQVLSPNSPELWAVDDGGPCVMDPAASPVAMDPFRTWPGNISQYFNLFTQYCGTCVLVDIYFEIKLLQLSQAAAAAAAGRVWLQINPPRLREYLVPVAVICKKKFRKR